MRQIKIIDVAIAHVKCSSGWNIPRFFEWYRGKEERETCFFTDLCIPQVDSIRAKCKVAWLLEPPTIRGDSYQYVRNNLHKFTYVFTYLKELVDNQKVFLAPIGGCWIPGPYGDIRNIPNQYCTYNKSKSISIIASDKEWLQGHKLRHEVIKNFRPKIGVYGRHYNPVANKTDALREYKYSIAIENSICDDYFTEKIIDCFVTGTVPIYWGTKNIGDYFNKNGIIQFDTIDQLREIIDNPPEIKHQDITDNFERVHRYTVAEDYIHWNYGHLFP